MLIYILPKYSPIKPRTINITPPRNNSTDIIELYPSTCVWLVNFLIISTIPYINPAIEQINPISEDNLNGLTEKEVKPFNHKDTSLVKE